MRIVVVGGGAVGLLLAGRLAIAGLRVQLVTRGEEQANKLATEPFRLQMLTGKVAEISVETISFAGSLPAADIYFLAVKQPALPQLLSALSTIPRSACVVALQNGMGHDELLATVLKPDQLLFAVNTEGVRRHSPTFVEHTGQGSLRMGPMDRPGEPDRQISRLMRMMQVAGIDCLYEQAMRPVMWRKLLANALINPLTALYEVPNGALVEHRFLLELMRVLFYEASEVARAVALKITDVDWQDILTICRNTSRNQSSMLQDLLSGRQTEIESINGYIMRTSKRYGIAVPAHEALYRSILLKTSLRQARREAFDDHSS
ncbi:2-dehydropantoate 2-reductase [Brevibacillus humidisoli]|uniref:ketopantoate reductase family protein n=1 Tax=Brevibacillus humidisoli TaxID=2895522 RepID=UPI001E65A16F|nr:2-dehydropantoate 2-reductase [Brevibacillus humidisoli]UFJ41909.1 2-dehydropantoate 2-reductase [Brevibacillus humidisoli]